MSLLNWQLAPEHVTVVSDTLVTDFDGKPLKHVSKIATLPHMDMMIGLTGFSDVLVRWNSVLSSWAPGASIDDLDDYAAEVLPLIWSDLFPEGCDLLTTVRHWGWSPKEGRFVGRSFRSPNGFAPEVMPDAWAFSPDPRPDHLETVVDSFERVIEVCRGQQEHGLAQPEGEKVYIGGRLIFHSLMRSEAGAVVASSYRVEDLPDLMT